MKYILLWLPRKIVRRLFMRLWRDEILEAHKYMQRKNLEAAGYYDTRKAYPLHESYGAMDVLAILDLYSAD